MLKRGNPPYLECSSKGEKRLSAFYARPNLLNGLSIEEAFQAMKILPDGSTNRHWRIAKGVKALNQQECAAAYEKWWREYILDNPDLLEMICNASGLSDAFGEEGHVCQAEVLWRIREENKMNNITVRESCKRRLPLDGADAQALEGALQQIERELICTLAWLYERHPTSVEEVCNEVLDKSGVLFKKVRNATG